MSSSQHEARLERWERRERPAFALLPYCLLAVSVGLDLGLNGVRGPDLALAAAAAALIPGLFRVGAPAARAVVFAALVAVMAALVIRTPLFGFFSWTGYVLVVPALRGRARVAGMAAVAFVTAISQNGGPPDSAGSWATYTAIVAINFAVAGAVSWFGWVGHEQGERRKQAIADLTDANARLEASLAENAALQAQLVEQAREAGVLEERERMARELHDTLAQGLAGIITQLQAAERGDWRRHHDAAAQLARESLSEARRAVQAMRPEPLAQARLPEALADVVRGWSQRSGVEAALTTTGEVRSMRPEVEVTLLRTAQEALANVSKHAQAGRVGLTLSYMEDLVSLDVRDDGVGFAPDDPVAGNGRDGGFGLTAMRQRVHGVGGVLAIESEPGGGTAISASVPAIALEGEA